MSNLYVVQTVRFTKELANGSIMMRDHPFITKYDEIGDVEKVIFKRTPLQDGVRYKDSTLLSAHLCIELDGELYEWVAIYE